MMSDRMATIIAGTGIIGSWTLEKLNAYAGVIIALLTIVILTPKFLSAIPTTISLLRKGYRRYLEETENDTDNQL